MNPPRIVFMGTPEIARISLAALLADDRFQVVAAVCQPDRPKGRHLTLQTPPVKELARQHDLPVLQPLRARDPNCLEALRALTPDLIVVLAYGHILPPSLLDLPRWGCVNLHTSLLPRHRGAAPIQWAIALGDTETGVTLMQMDAGMDTGPILAQQATPITSEDTGQTLHDRLAVLGAELLTGKLPQLLAGALPGVPQPAEGATLAPKIKREDGLIDWNQPATVIYRRLRAFDPWPGVFTHVPIGGKPHLLKLWQAQPESAPGGSPGEILAADKHGIVVRCGEGSLRITEVQSEGTKRMHAAAYLLGHPLTPGQRLR